MELSNRLETIASFVTEGYVVADIGTDHGYIPIYLTSNGNCPRAYAMDVNKEPLSRAKTHIEEETYFQDNRYVFLLHAAVLLV